MNIHSTKRGPFDVPTHPWRLTRFLWIAALLAGLSVLATLIDVRLTRFANTEDMPGDLRRIIELSEVFAHGFGVALASILIWRLVPSLRRMIPRLICCAVMPGLMVHVVKLLVIRRRPAYFYPQFADYVDDTWVGYASDGSLNIAYLTQSFPSAHTATAFGLAIALSWMVPRGRFIFYSLALLASFQRIEAGAHWLSDVLAGAAIAVLVCGFVFQSWGLGKLLDRFERPGLSNHTMPRQEIKKAA